MPYPEPVDYAASKIGRANRRTDTKPEVRLRSALHRRGLRFRKDFLIRAGEVRVRPDIVFTRLKLALFVDGCFWHSCPEHGSIPKRNREYWLPKLAANAERDRRVNAALEASGWAILRLWEHEGTDRASSMVLETVERREMEDKHAVPWATVGAGKQRPS